MFRWASSSQAFCSQPKPIPRRSATAGSVRIATKRSFYAYGPGVLYFIMCTALQSSEACRDRRATDPRHRLGNAFAAATAVARASRSRRSSIGDFPPVGWGPGLCRARLGLPPLTSTTTGARLTSCKLSAVVTASVDGGGGPMIMRFLEQRHRRQTNWKGKGCLGFSPLSPLRPSQDS
eukprot:SAG25_NODE_262_length_10711_cov_10.264512_7_plen_178_part_00